MKLPLSLIQSFIDLAGFTPKAIGDTLTLLGIEVDRIQNETPSFSGVVVAEVREASPHPNAAKLQVAEVFDGKETFQVVCGAPNCRKGIKTAFARPGAILGETKIEKAHLRGVDSCGMLCAEDELNVPETMDGIVELPQEMETGANLTSLLWDPIFEISLTPNLGHAMSALGIARELSSALKRPLLELKSSLHEEGRAGWEKEWKLEIKDKELCPVYHARLIENVTIGPSPYWLQKILVAAGHRPINNAVDIGNYILLKFGQPLHFFDADQVEGKVLKIAPATSSTAFKGLDGVQREIAPGTLLISDAKEAVAVAGILGAERGSTQLATKNILIEAALFDPKVIRLGMKNIDLRTESGQRFEKGIDAEGVQRALDEAASLTAQICHGKIAKGRLGLGATFHPKKIKCRPERVNQLLGTHISLSEMDEIFQRLQFKTKLVDGQFELDVPHFRTDVTAEIDLVEEIARIYGYNQIESKGTKYQLSSVPHDASYLFEKEVRKALLELGLQEFLTSDLISPQACELVKEWLQPGISLLKALKPKTEEYSVLRPSLLPGLLDVALFNLNQKNGHFAAYEIGNIHLLAKNELLEQPMIGIVLAGQKAPSHWSEKSEPFEFFDLKGLIENLLEFFPIPASFKESAHPSFHPHAQADLVANGLVIGSFGKLHPKLLEKKGIKEPLFYAELDLAHLQRLCKKKLRVEAIPKFPGSERDWTLPLPPKTCAQKIFDSLEKHRPELLEKIELLDLYQPQDAQEKMATFRFFYRDLSKTVSFEEVEKVHQELIGLVTNCLQNEGSSE